MRALVRRLAVVAVATCGVASACGFDDAPEEATAIERIAGVASVDLEGGYQWSEWVRVTLDRDLSVAEVRRVVTEIGSTLGVQNTRWGAADLTLTRPDDDGKDVYTGTARDLGSDVVPRAADLEGWLTLAVCPRITAGFSGTYSYGDPTPLAGPTEAVARCLDALPRSEGVREGIERREVALVAPGLTMRWDPALTADVWRAVSAAWRRHDPAVTALDIDLNTYPGGDVQVAGDITLDGSAIDGWTPTAHRDQMGAAIDPLIRSVAGVTAKHHWTLKGEPGGLLVFGSIDEPGGHVDTTVKPGHAAWNSWFDRHLAQLV